MRVEGGRGDQFGAVRPRIAQQGWIRFLTIKDPDGGSGAAQRYREPVRGEADLGGHDRLSTTQRQPGVLPRSMPTQKARADFGSSDHISILRLSDASSRSPC